MAINGSLSTKKPVVIFLRCLDSDNFDDDDINLITNSEEKVRIDTLLQRGYSVHTLFSIKSENILTPEKVLDMFRETKFGAIITTSQKAAKSLAKIINSATDACLKNSILCLTIFCLGRPTSRFLLNQGFKNVIGCDCINSQELCEKIINFPFVSHIPELLHLASELTDESVSADLADSYLTVRTTVLYRISKNDDFEKSLMETINLYPSNHPKCVIYFSPSTFYSAKELILEQKLYFSNAHHVGFGKKTLQAVKQTFQEATMLNTPDTHGILSKLDELFP